MFLTLDESTLFYWTLSDESHTGKKQEHISAINKWASVVHSIKSSSQAPKSSSSHTRDDIPSLTSGTTSDWTYAPSVLSENIWILSHQSSDTVKVKANAPEILVYNNGGLLYNDELTGEEWEVAIKSPPKGKKQMTSEVVSFFSI